MNWVIINRVVNVIVKNKIRFDNKIKTLEKKIIKLEQNLDKPPKNG
jgi:hypothetical protein